MAVGTLPKRARITIPQYSDKSWYWNWISGGSPVDFTGCTAKLSLRVTPSDAAPAVAVTTTPNAAGVIVLGTSGNGNAGLVQLTLFKAGNATLTAPMLHGEIILTLSDASTVLFMNLDARLAQGSTY